MPSQKSLLDGHQPAQPRLRVLAGPNGSGKSTIKGELKPEWIGVSSNLDRVRRRVKQGGHPVPAKKVRERYVRSIALLTEACGTAHRTDVFDNSGSQHRLLVQVVDGHEMEIEAGSLPRWFIETELWQSFNA